MVDHRHHQNHRRRHSNRRRLNHHRHQNHHRRSRHHQNHYHNHHSCDRNHLQNLRNRHRIPHLQNHLRIRVRILIYKFLHEVLAYRFENCERSVNLVCYFLNS